MPLHQVFVRDPVTALLEPVINQLTLPFPLYHRPYHVKRTTIIKPDRHPPERSNQPTPTGNANLWRVRRNPLALRAIVSHIEIDRAPIGTHVIADQIIINTQATFDIAVERLLLALLP